MISSSEIAEPQQSSMLPVSNNELSSKSSGVANSKTAANQATAWPGSNTNASTINGTKTGTHAVRLPPVLSSEGKGSKAGSTKSKKSKHRINSSTVDPVSEGSKKNTPKVAIVGSSRKPKK